MESVVWLSNPRRLSQAKVGAVFCCKTSYTLYQFYNCFSRRSLCLAVIRNAIVIIRDVKSNVSAPGFKFLQEPCHGSTGFC